jgi:hypothetical protein
MAKKPISKQSGAARDDHSLKAARSLADRSPRKVSVPWFGFARILFLAALGAIAAAWAAHRALTLKPEPMLVPRPTNNAEPWPPPSTVEITDLNPLPSTSTSTSTSTPTPTTTPTATPTPTSTPPATSR